MAFDFILVSTFSTKMALNTCGWIYSLRANPNSCTLSIRYFENTSSWYGSSFIAQYNILIRLTTTLSFLADDNLSFCVAFHDFRIAVVGRPHSQLPPELRGSLLWGDCVYDFPPRLARIAVVRQLHFSARTAFAISVRVEFKCRASVRPAATSRNRSD